MLELVKRLSNKNAVPVTKKLAAPKNAGKYTAGGSPDPIAIAKGVYMGLVDHISGADKKEMENLLFFIENLEFDEQKVFDYFRSALWNYNRVVDAEIDKFYSEANDIMSRIG